MDRVKIISGKVHNPDKLEEKLNTFLDENNIKTIKSVFVTHAKNPDYIPNAIGNYARYIYTVTCVYET